MNVIEINSVNFGSTGKIVSEISMAAKKKGLVVFTSCASSRSTKKKQVPGQIFIGNSIERNFHAFISYVLGLEGIASVVSTRLFLKWLKKNKISCIHLHNLHSNYINIPMLFDYIKKNRIICVWTLHDCWAFTGRCPHFSTTKCEMWKTGCYNCPYPKEQYPRAKIDRSKQMWTKKRKWFTDVENMTIVTPSEWLADLVKQSFLKEYPVKVINNGIDLSVFKPINSDFRKKYQVSVDKSILLGVAFGWGKRKGFDVFLELAKRLDSEKYQIVLVGTDDTMDKQLPDNIISIHRTQNQQELAEIYSAADLFVNPTREDNYPTVNMEALACGTPVLTFRTGGSPEIPDETCGSVVDCDDVDALGKEIIRICEEKPFTKEACIKRAEQFDMNARFDEYIELYSRVLRDRDFLNSR